MKEVPSVSLSGKNIYNSVSSFESSIMSTNGGLAVPIARVSVRGRGYVRARAWVC